MVEATLVPLAFGAYLAALCVITWRSRSAAREGAGFVLGNRQVGVLGTLASQQVSITDGTGFIMLVTFGATMGFGLLWFSIGTSVAYLLLALQAGRVRSLAEERGYLTVSDLLRDRIGPKTAWCSVAVITVTMFLSMGGSLHIAGQMFAELFGLVPASGVCITAVVIGAYLIVGGYMTVIRTDVLQWLVVAGLAAFAYLFADYPSLEEMFHQFVTVSAAETAALSVLFFFVNYAYVDTWQRIFSARSTAVARRGTALSIPTRFFVTIGFILFGCTIRQVYPGVHPEQFVYESFTNPAIAPVIGVAMGLGLVCLIMSTLDSRAYYIATTVASSFLKIDPDRQRRAFLRVSRTSVVVMLVLLSLVAISLADVVQYMINISSMFAVLAPMMFIALVYSPCNRARFDRWMAAALAFGTLLFAVMSVADLFGHYAANLVPPAVSCVLCLLAVGRDRLARAESFRAALAKGGSPGDRFGTLAAGRITSRG